MNRREEKHWEGGGGSEGRGEGRRGYTDNDGEANNSDVDTINDINDILDNGNYDNNKDNNGNFLIYII